MHSSTSSTIERLEPRISPAGVVAVSVSAAGTVLLKSVPGMDGDEVVTLTQLADGAYRLTLGGAASSTFHAPVTLLRLGGDDEFHLGGTNAVTHVVNFLAKVIADGGASVDTVPIGPEASFAIALKEIGIP